MDVKQSMAMHVLRTVPHRVQCGAVPVQVIAQRRKVRPGRPSGPPPMVVKGRACLKCSPLSDVRSAGRARGREVEQGIEGK